ncbi:hypothetical protein A33Q_1072 [Indibacter alkaliphilus LW1]|uniref:Uncharacterized protein n=1 Tax=Indibacter alkaliphilus (strain CCUG 57479 / KCTC 22604 / LW1) TaxID=1189612 RepID=S2E808_INDAL|nr:hypothetical protein [Indibacter alkaliphilus]EOZ98418.1 hypothetical protein A33Q_1072 [Indibacter alkaliphilus LW1]
MKWINSEKFTLDKKEIFRFLRDLSEDEVVSDDFLNSVEKAYVLAEPLREFLKKANSL